MQDAKAGQGAGGQVGARRACRCPPPLGADKGGGDRGARGAGREGQYQAGGPGGGTGKVAAGASAGKASAQALASREAVGAGPKTARERRPRGRRDRNQPFVDWEGSSPLPEAAGKAVEETSAAGSPLPRNTVPLARWRPPHLGLQRLLHHHQDHQHHHREGPGHAIAAMLTCLDQRGRCRRKNRRR